MTAVTPHDEEHLLYESGAVISTDDSVCVFAVEGAIFIRRNSVGTPEGKCFTLFGTEHPSSCHSDSGVVKSTRWGGQDCHSASHWTYWPRR